MFEMWMLEVVSFMVLISVGMTLGTVGLVIGSHGLFAVGVVLSVIGLSMETKFVRGKSIS